jgi:hypothetical protein
MTLYRPVGQREYELIAESGFRAFPPRLAEQPYFCPVANEEYALQIARDAASHPLDSYPARVSRERAQTEYWVRSDERAVDVARIGS